MVSAALAITDPHRVHKTSRCFGTLNVELADALNVSKIESKFDQQSILNDQIRSYGRCLPWIGQGWLLIEVPVIPPARAAIESVGVPPDP